MIILGIIPARYASTRFPGKPLVNINGLPMIQRVYEQANKILTEVCVATDDTRIQDAVKEFGGNVVMTSSNHTSGTDRCAEAVTLYEKNKNIKVDIIINIQGDEPFIEPIQISQLINTFNKETEIATLIKKINSVDILEDTNKVKVVIDNKNNALYFSRSIIPYIRNTQKKEWLKKHDFYHHIGMYGYKRNVLMNICKLNKSPLEVSESLEQLRWLENGYKITTAITNIESMGIDTPNDLEKVLNKIKS